MRAYYNEIDPGAAAWLRELIAGGHIAPGDVDERSIEIVHHNDLKSYTQCHFFAGIGGWSYALRLAGWPDDRPVWTGSCPCQPFSLAGKQKGFADDRHLWPRFRELIAQRSPAVVFGEQVASASAWLGLVRSDLETLGYAVGAAPVQAASAGADHLRDRFWFVADGECQRRAARRSSDAGHEGRAAFAEQSGVSLADAYDAGSQGREVLPERASERAAWPDGVADSDCERGQIDQDTGGRPQGSSPRPIAGLGGASDGDVGDASCIGGGAGLCESDALGHGDGTAGASGAFEWVVGADGKARRVKPGIRLLADGFPSRVGLLRGFGNAIDPRPAAAFIKAADEAMKSVRTNPLSIRHREGT